MNIQDLKHEWKTHNTMNSMVMELFRESRQTKIDRSMQKITIYTILFMVFNLVVNFFAWWVLVQHFSNLTLMITGILTLILTYIAFFSNVWQLSYILRIDHSKPIVELHKIIGKLKLQRIRHNRFIFIFSYLFFWSMVILLFKFDLSIILPAVWENAAIVLIVHVGMAIIWFPLSLWLLRAYDENNKRSKFWKNLGKDSFLTDQSVNFSLNNSILLLEEIEAFEKEEE